MTSSIFVISNFSRISNAFKIFIRRGLDFSIILFIFTVFPHIFSIILIYQDEFCTVASTRQDYKKNLFENQNFHIFPVDIFT